VSSSNALKEQMLHFSAESLAASKERAQQELLAARAAAVTVGEMAFGSLVHARPG
jgi:hypothetical protein